MTKHVAPFCLGCMFNEPVKTTAIYPFTYFLTNMNKKKKNIFYKFGQSKPENTTTMPH
jgi:hypothetical protein